uniref:Uncharacterized protein n=1 Tax=Ditylenchus dipsaci TaxID=166011 RepID=A0A915DLA5_9BILA
MQPFAWTEPCVVEMLQALKNKEVSVVDVVQFFKKEFHVTKGKQAIYNHMRATVSTDMFLGENDVITEQNESGQRRQQVSRFYEKEAKRIYECINCRHNDEDDKLKPLKTLKEKGGCYILNKGIHHITCFL